MNPLVPVTTLYEKCVEDTLLEGALTREALLAFLGNHADILLVDGSAPVDCAFFDEAGMCMEERVILKSRVPTREEMKELFRMQLSEMRARLGEAIEQAHKCQDIVVATELEAALKRSEELEAKMRDF